MIIVNTLLRIEWIVRRETLKTQNQHQKKHQTKTFCLETLKTVKLTGCNLTDLNYYVKILVHTSLSIHLNNVVL